MKKIIFSVLTFVLCVFLASQIKPVFAQVACAQAVAGAQCRPVCGATEGQVSGATCANGFTCCVARPMNADCGACTFAIGCTCPATCNNTSASSGGNCGGIKANPGNPGNPQPANPGGNSFQDVFGTVKAPDGVSQYNTGAPSNIGLIKFISRLIQVATVIAGIIVFVNFILAGFMFISSDGNASVNEKVRNQITMSVIGLVLIVASYTIIAILSLLLFGKADYILSPTF